ncbi:MAG: dedA protein [Candidatus Saccharibacteria bacterium]|nr:dedA protein [Candidatus Saccharibacteria bacterium]
MSIDKYILGGGLLAIGLTVFAESGLLIGFFLPGDTLLFGAGILAAQGVLPIEWLIVTIVVAAIAGDNVGYTIGRKFGPRLFKRKDGIIFRQEYLRRAEEFYQKHGGKTIILARFVPIVRTFAPVVAGIGTMSRKKFFAYNVIGGLLWGISLPLAGYYIGSKLPWLEHYIEPAILAVVVLSIGPALIHLLRNDMFRAAAAKKIRNGFRKITLRP